jgi:hypothetical protein
MAKKIPCMSKTKTIVYAAISALATEAMIALLFLRGHYGGELPPDLLGWIGLLLCFPGILAIFAGSFGMVLTPLLVFVQYFLLYRFLLRRIYPINKKPWDSAGDNSPR